MRPPSEAEAQTWDSEDDDMAEGDLGYGLGRRPGGIYEVQVSHLFTSRKRSDDRNFSPPPFPGKGEERSGAIFQYSRHKSLQDTYPEGSRILHHRRQSNSGKMPSILSLLLPCEFDQCFQRMKIGRQSGFLEIYLYLHCGIVINVFISKHCPNREIH